MKRGFTLVEMLVVLGIIAVLIGASLAGFSKMTKSAERSRAQELVSNVATALTAYFQQNGSWPTALLGAGETGGRLDATAARVLGRKGLISMTLDSSGKPAGLDKFGLVTPWATSAIKHLGTKAELSSKVADTTATIENHILHYAIDVNGDGLIEGVRIGTESIDVRATAIVWSIGKKGGNNGEPWPYMTGLRKDDVYSWTRGQVKK